MCQIEEVASLCQPRYLQPLEARRCPGPISAFPPSRPEISPTTRRRAETTLPSLPSPSGLVLLKNYLSVPSGGHENAGLESSVLEKPLQKPTCVWGRLGGIYTFCGGRLCVPTSQYEPADKDYTYTGCLGYLLVLLGSRARSNHCPVRKLCTGARTVPHPPQKLCPYFKQQPYVEHIPVKVRFS